MLRSLFAAALLCELPAVQGAAQTPPDTTAAVIRAGPMFDAEAGTFTAAGAILVRGGRIVSVAEHVDHPAGARIIDLSRYTVMPGLIDAHTHLL